LVNHLLAMTTLVQRFQPGRFAFPKLGKQVAQLFRESDKRGMLKNGTAQVLRLNPLAHIALTKGRKQMVPQSGTDLPEAVESVHVARGNPALQMTRQILDILLLAAVDVAG